MSSKAEVDAALQDVDLDANDYQLQLKTSEGDILLNLLADVAPGHCRNMIGLAKIGFYNGLIFHRIIDGFMIQGGCPEGSGMGSPGYTIEAEFNSTPHELGVLSMARSQHPDSAGSQFFICLETTPHLDGQYTAFGKTADDASSAVVKKIGDVATGANDRPVDDVRIEEVTVLSTPKS